MQRQSAGKSVAALVAAADSCTSVTCLNQLPAHAS